jgi:hypothetical protein
MLKKWSGLQYLADIFAFARLFFSSGDGRKKFIKYTILNLFYLTVLLFLWFNN